MSDECKHGVEKIMVCRDCDDDERHYTPSPRQLELFDSLLKSAEAWAAEGLKELKIAGDAVRIQNHNTAENHRKNALMAFECELNLRKLAIHPSANP